MTKNDVKLMTTNILCFVRLNTEHFFHIFEARNER